MLTVTRDMVLPTTIIGSYPRPHWFDRSLAGRSFKSALDCGFGREGLSRRIAFYKCVALVEGTNIVRRELGLPEARVRAADPKLWFAGRASTD